MKKILIITHSKDNECVDIVSKKINELNGLPIRFNVDEYPLKYSISSCYENNEWKVYLDYQGVRVAIHDVEAVWYRRSHNLGSGLTEVLEKEFLSSAFFNSSCLSIASSSNNSSKSLFGYFSKSSSV